MRMCFAFSDQIFFATPGLSKSSLCVLLGIYFLLRSPTVLLGSGWKLSTRGHPAVDRHWSQIASKIVPKFRSLYMLQKLCLFSTSLQDFFWGFVYGEQSKEPSFICGLYLLLLLVSKSCAAVSFSRFSKFIYDQKTIECSEHEQRRFHTAGRWRRSRAQRSRRKKKTTFSTWKWPVGCQELFLEGFHKFLAWSFLGLLFLF